MTNATTFVTRHPVATYVALTFAISWGGFVVVVGPGGFPGTGSQFDRLLPFVASAMLAGPAVAGLLMTVLLSGTAGLRELLSSLLRWRVGMRWYIAALLPAPLLAAAVLFALSVPSPILTASDKTAILLAGIAAGLTTVFEEIGWTGFATPMLRRRYGVVTTGLIVGVIWGAWHLLQGLWSAGTYAGSLPVATFFILSFVIGVAQLTAYRVLMLWVYDKTRSLLVATLMHASLTASTVFIFTPAATGATFLTCTSTLAAAMWVVVAAVAWASSGQLLRRPLQRRIASRGTDGHEGGESKKRQRLPTAGGQRTPRTKVGESARHHSGEWRWVRSDPARRRHARAARRIHEACTDLVLHRGVALHRLYRRTFSGTGSVRADGMFATQPQRPGNTDRTEGARDRETNRRNGGRAWRNGMRVSRNLAPGGCSAAAIGGSVRCRGRATRESRGVSARYGAG